MSTVRRAQRRRLAWLIALACAVLVMACSGSNNGAGNGAQQHPPRADFATPPGRPDAPPPPSLGAMLPDLGGLVVASPVAGSAYNSDPPTSGPQLAAPPRRGIYANPLENEALTAFLARGGVEVLYNSSASPDVVRMLTDLVNAEIDREPGLVLLAPRPQMPCEVTVTAWTRIIAFGTPSCQPGSQGHPFGSSQTDQVLVRQFIERSMCVYDPQNACGKGASASPSASP